MSINRKINAETGETMTKAEVRRRTVRCAQHLRKLGCTPDQRIAIVARNHHNLTPLLFASFCIGTPSTALDVTGGALHLIYCRTLIDCNY